MPEGASSSPTPASGLFDPTRVHELSVSFAQAEYNAMLETYKTSGETSWIRATVKNDGKTHGKVGIRLKGNSSIMAWKGRVSRRVCSGHARPPGSYVPSGRRHGH